MEHHRASCCSRQAMVSLGHVCVKGGRPAGCMPQPPKNTLAGSKKAVSHQNTPKSHSTLTPSPKYIEGVPQFTVYVIPFSKLETTSSLRLLLSSTDTTYIPATHSNTFIQTQTQNNPVHSQLSGPLDN